MFIQVRRVFQNNEALSERGVHQARADKPVLFAFHAYAWLIRRWNRQPTTSAFTATRQGFHHNSLRRNAALNNMDRWALAADALRAIDAQKWADQIDEWEDSHRAQLGLLSKEARSQHSPTGLGQTLPMLIRLSPQLRQPLATTSNALELRKRAFSPVSTSCRCRRAFLMRNRRC